MDFNSITADVLELADHRLLEDIVSVTTRLATDVPAVYADPGQLKRQCVRIELFGTRKGSGLPLAGPRTRYRCKAPIAYPRQITTTEDGE